MPEKSRFTSDRRVPSSSSWRDDTDWAAGVAEDVDVVDGGLIGRPPNQYSELPDSVVDNFEDYPDGPYGDEDSPKTFYTEGPTDALSRVTDTTRSGGCSLQFDHTGGGTSEVFSIGGLPRYIERGDSFEVWVRHEGGDANWKYVAIYWGVDEDDTSNRNIIQLNPGENHWTLNDNGRMSAASSQNTWYRIRVTWHEDGDVTGAVYTSHGDEIVSTTTSERDGAVSGGGIGFKSGQGSAGNGTVNCYYDDFKIV